VHLVKRGDLVTARATLPRPSSLAGTLIGLAARVERAPGGELDVVPRVIGSVARLRVAASDGKIVALPVIGGVPIPLPETVFGNGHVAVDSLTATDRGGVVTVVARGHMR
jgi:hypothetical protein